MTKQRFRNGNPQICERRWEETKEISKFVCLASKLTEMSSSMNHLILWVSHT
jgi:hypothetical protein